jgi:diguanylate cyclase
MKALRQNATPRNYEIWYAFASGYHPALNQQINATLKAKGSISTRPLVRQPAILSVRRASTSAG